MAKTTIGGSTVSYITEDGFPVTVSVTTAGEHIGVVDEQEPVTETEAPAEPEETTEDGNSEGEQTPAPEGENPDATDPENKTE